MTDEVKAIEFVAEIRQVKTMADHTSNITINLPEYCSKQSAWSLEHHGAMIKVFFVLQSLTNGEEEINQRTAIDPLGMVGG